MENNKKNRKASLVLADQIVETVYDSKQEQTQFAIYKDNGVQYAESIKTTKGDFFPLNPHNDLVNKKVVLLPSDANEYGTTEQLLGDIQSFIRKYLDISPQFEQIGTYYVLSSWLYDRFNELPYLRCIGDLGSGKSRFLQTIGCICYRPIITSGATTVSPIFRILDEMGGTLILDEADFKSSEMSDDIIKILNCGYQRGISVLRAEGKGVYEVKAYNVFSPKIIATRETFNDKALESRCLTEEMGRTVLRKDIPIRLTDKFYEEAQELRNKLLMWRFRNYRKELIFDDTPIAGINPRLQQIITMLMTLMESEKSKQMLREFAQKYNAELIAERGMSRESNIIYAILELEKNTFEKTLTVGEIADCVNRDVDEIDKISARKVGWYLRKKLQLKPYKMRNGFVLNLESSKDRLDYWKDRFAITDTDLQSEHVNDVNVPVGDMPTELTAKDVGF